MSTNSNKYPKLKFALLFASASLAVAVTSGALPALAQRANSNWGCYLNHQDDKHAGDVKIWWGHTSADAAWACNNWISKCGNEGGCFAKQK